MKLYVIGGAVRDTLLDRPVNDKDYVVVGTATNSPEFKQLVQDKGLMLVGNDFPVFISCDDEEYAFARKERKVAPGYHGFDVSFDPTVTLEDDVFRRDLTINSMAVAAEDWDKFVETKDTSLVLDYTGKGLSDLAAGVLRHVSAAFAEDPVRVLRIARFAARYHSFTIAKETVELMWQLVDSGELDHLVPERVWSEFERALTEPFPVKFFQTLMVCNAVTKLFPYYPMNFSAMERGALRKLSPEDLFALLCTTLSVDYVDALCDKLKAPLCFRDLAVKATTLYHFCNTEMYYTPGPYLRLIGDTFGWHNQKDLHRVASALALTDASQSQVDTVLMVFEASYRVSFSSLTKEQQTTLKGRDIGQAIHMLRYHKVHQCFNTKISEE